ncbi:competence type IV pilus minor pilin ComGF [Lentilactobacillus kisonensis]|uniref:Prepilin-type cleavage/methylation protein n=2 Tax=Lentilactobacillus kisonensis TaxID=481722 RepID=H1LJK2_9LACO|nr:competence type IV pilus minor pilin ComGF [Lentilactobacillus kisonensis]EHO48574.1 hypothetical protein HMPREF9104_02794 [Lentilactobacillus kisonensis F0435]KRL23282.1 hypothetical protein FC98_GL000004 [Lentilactobacillus kisonensis DSM 19906 = JCM 15041]
MKKRSNDNHFKKRSGYLLIESLVSLLICVLAVWTITVMINYMGRAKNKQVIAFYEYIQLLESSRYQFQIRGIHSRDVKLYSSETQKIYHMQQYDDMIRITGAKLGHVRLLSTIKNVNWSYDRRCLKTIVTFENGQRCLAYSDLSTK